MFNRGQMFLDRVRGEYDEMPDLKLTNWQACRLWNLEAQLCDDILATLLREGFLSRTASGAYVRRTPVRRLPVRASGPDWLPGGPGGDEQAERDESGDDDPPSEQSHETPGHDTEAELVALGV